MRAIAHRLVLLGLSLSLVLLAGVLPCHGAIPWTKDDPDSAFHEATVRRQPVLIYFFTTWCSWCAEMEDKVFSDEEVTYQANAFVPLRLNCDRREGLRIAHKYNVSSFPTVLAVTSEGQVLGRMAMYKPAADILRFLRESQNPAETLEAVDKKIQAGDRSPALLLRSADRHFEAGESDVALGRYKEAIATVESGRAVTAHAPDALPPGSLGPGSTHAVAGPGAPGEAGQAARQDSTLMKTPVESRAPAGDQATALPAVPGGSGQDGSGTPTAAARAQDPAPGRVPETIAAGAHASTGESGSQGSSQGAAPAQAQDAVSGRDRTAGGGPAGDQGAAGETASGSAARTIRVEAAPGGTPRPSGSDGDSLPPVVPGAPDRAAAPAPAPARSASAGPVIAEPAVAEPAVAEPAVAEPAVAEPAIAEPAIAGPAVAEPAVAEPAVAEPAVAGPAVVRNPVGGPPPETAADNKTGGSGAAGPPRVPKAAAAQAGRSADHDADADADEVGVLARLGLGRIKWMKGDTDGALEQYRIILRSYPASKHLAEAFVAALAISREENHEADIDAMFHEFADRFPSDPAVLNDHARRLLATGADATLALSKALKATSLSPDSPDFGGTLARALLANGRPQEALEAVTTAIGQRPTDKELRLLQLEVLEHLRKTKR